MCLLSPHLPSASSVAIQVSGDTEMNYFLFLSSPAYCKFRHETQQYKGSSPLTVVRSAPVGPGTMQLADLEHSRYWLHQNCDLTNWVKQLELSVKSRCYWSAHESVSENDSQEIALLAKESTHLHDLNFESLAVFWVFTYFLSPFLRNILL